MFQSIKKVHFIGIGGVGMSGIAEILLDRGFKVSGSDLQLSEVTDRLARFGAEIREGHSPEHITGDIDVVVYSSAVARDNTEIREAESRRIPIIRRAEMLAELMRLKYGISVAGTHGKTTTTSLTSLVLLEGRLDPTVIVGGKLSGIGGTNARLGKGDFIVVEADEFDRSFLSMTATIAVLTSIEADHLDCYNDIDEIKDAFIQFANKVPFYGSVVLCIDEPELRNIMPNINKKIITYGLSHEADIYAVDIKQKDMETAFTVVYHGKQMGRITLSIPGVHNVKNALAALVVGLELGVNFSDAKKGLEKFSGIERRTEIKYRNGDYLVIDDYAHHPTEIKTTLEGIRKGWPGRRILCVFQPHLYSRTQNLFERFGESFSAADVLIVTGIYPAREKPIKGVEGDLITEAAKQFGHGDCTYVENKNEIPELLKRKINKGDIVVIMGAGDIWKSSKQFVGYLEGRDGIS